MLLSALLAIAATASTVPANTVRTFDPLHETKQQKDARMAWWRYARFGMFIHWGLYAVPGGEWNGKDYDGAGEWLQYNAKIKPADYEPLQKKFNPVNFDAAKWVRIAKNAGMKYIVITSKHHEGFDMWPTKEGTWNIGYTQFHRDPLAELSKACNKAGIRLCFYYSIMDWHEPDYLPRRPWDDRPTTDASYDRYVAYMKAQLKELITNYHPGIIWFDGEWEDTWTHERGVDLYSYVRSLDPKIIVNNRVDTGRSGLAGTAPVENVGDYGTPEQTIPANGIPGKDWETCMTMNDTWGFHKTDNDWKSPETLIHNLVDIASKGGNYLLNVGPTPLGEIPDASVERLAAMGKWTQTNGESLYGTTASPFPRALPWGRVTQRPGKLYLHVFDQYKPIILTGLKTQVTRAYLLTDKRQALAVTHSGPDQAIRIDQPLPDNIDTVIVAEIDGPAVVENRFPVLQVRGSTNLEASDAELHGDTIQYESDNHAVGYWTNPNDSVSWAVKVDEPGDYELSLDLACEPSTAGGTFRASIGSYAVEGTVPATKDWHTFTRLALGPIHVDRAGTYDVTIKPLKMAGFALMNLRSVTIKPGD